MATMPCQIYRYFEPDTIAVFNELVAPVKPVNKPASRRAETPQVRKIRLNKNYRQQNVYYKEHNVYQHEKKDWDEFNTIDAKLQE